MSLIQNIWNKHFSEKIRRRGYSYFKDNLVKNLSITDNKVKAVVHGSKRYKVEIEFSNMLEPIVMYCTCPYFETDNCKHLAAVLYAINDVGFFKANLNAQNIKDDSVVQKSPNSAITTTKPSIFNAPSAQVISGQAANESKEKINWEKHLQQEREKQKFTAFKNKVSGLITSKKTKISKTKYKIAYAIGLGTYAHSSTIHVIRQRLLKDGSVGSMELAHDINFDNVEPLDLQERLIVSYLTKTTYDNYVHFGDHYNSPNDIRVKQSFSDILTFLADKEVYLYTGYNLSHKIFIKKEIGYCELLIEDDENNLIIKPIFYIGEEKIQSGTKIQAVLDKPLWILAGNNVFRISNLQYNQLESFFNKEGAILIPKVYLNYFEENVLPQVASMLPIVSSKYSAETIKNTPKKKLFLEESDSLLFIKLKFGYDAFDVEYNEAETITTFISEGKIHRVIRNKILEEQARREIKSFFVKELNAGVFTPRKNPIDFLFNSLSLLRELGFEVFGETELKKYKLNTSKPNISLSVSSGIDWFDVTANIDFNGANLPFEELIELIKKKKRYVQLSDGSVGILPEQWINKFIRTLSLGELEGNKIRFNKFQANALDLILNEADEAEADAAFKEQVEKLNSFEKIKKQLVPKTFKGKLRKYQKAGLDWLYFLQEYSFGGILADDMGLGKTIQVLTLLAKEKTYRQKKPNLIVAPTSVVFNWMLESKRFTPSLKILNHTGSDRIKDNGLHFDKYNAVVTSYAILLRDFELFKQQPFNYVVLDESQKIKNPFSKSARLVKRLNADHRLCLTGTPIENNLNELWSQISFLNPGMLGSLKKFQDAFVKPIQKMNDNEASEFLKKTIYPFVLRRTKELVAKELPPKTEMIHYCEMESEQMKVYELLKDSIRFEIMKEINEKGIKKSGFKIIEGLLRLRQVCNHPVLFDKTYRKNSGKFEEFKEMLGEVLNEGHKVLVFSQFVKMLEVIKEYLNNKKISYEYLTGNTKDREERVNNFQKNDKVKIFLISLKAGGFGLNLTAADYVFHYDPWWNPAVEIQATDRAHRIGQNKNVFIYKFITKNSVEEKILLLQEKKRALVQNIITSETGVLKNLTKADIDILFS
jgi:non-specific serine/threonine protein kinase